MILAFDVESTGTDIFHGCRPFLVTMCDGKKNYYWWGLVDPYTREVSWEEEDVREIESMLRKAVRIVAHNGNFDLRMLAAIGVDITGMHEKLEDTLVASHAICSGDTHGLKDLLFKYFGIPNDLERDLEDAVKAAIPKAKARGWDIARHGHRHFPGLSKNGTEFWRMDYWICPELCLKYALNDPEGTLRLWEVFRHEIIKCGMWSQYRTRIRLLKTAYNIQTRGRNLDIEEMDRLTGSLDRDIEQHIFNLRRHADIHYRFNHNSREHLSDLLFHRLGLEPLRTEKGTPRVDKNTIQHYIKHNVHPALTELKIIRRKAKQKKNIQSLRCWADKYGRTHSNLNVTGTRETRQSSSAPNDQNNDKALMYLFVPPPGYVWIHIDLKNIELRIWAYLSGSKQLIQAFEQGISVHFVIMQTLFPKEAEIYNEIKDTPANLLSPEHRRILKMYTDVKSGTFARLYGATDNKANDTYNGGIKSTVNYCAIIDAKIPGVKDFITYCRRQCMTTFRKDKVFGIYTKSGYRLDVDPDKVYAATNYYIQGLAGWIVGEAMIAWEDHPVYAEYCCHMNAQVHDSIDTEVPIQPNLQYVIDTKLRVIEAVGMKYIPNCPSDYKLIYNKADETDPLLYDFIT